MFASTLRNRSRNRSVCIWRMEVEVELVGPSCPWLTDGHLFVLDQRLKEITWVRSSSTHRTGKDLLGVRLTVDTSDVVKAIEIGGAAVRAAVSATGLGTAVLTAASATATAT